MKRRWVSLLGLCLALVIAATPAAAACPPIAWRLSAGGGFGDPANSVISALAAYSDRLYAGAANYAGGAQLWRQDPGGAWTRLLADGFGNAHNTSINRLYPFSGWLYAGIENVEQGGQLWRWDGASDWALVAGDGFGDVTNAEVNHLVAFKQALLASTWSYTSTHGLELWRSVSGAPGSWSRVVANGFGDSRNCAILASAEYAGRLYVGTYSLRMAEPFDSTGGEVWRSLDGLSWSQVNADGFGSADNQGITSLAAFGTHLYASTLGKAGHGCEIWRCQACSGSDWSPVAVNGLGDVNNRGMSSLEVFDGQLYVFVGNSATGMEVWRSANGTQWERVAGGGFGNPNNRAPAWDGSTAAYNGRLYVGTFNYVDGGEVWQSGVPAYLPAVARAGGWRPPPAPTRG